MGPPKSSIHCNAVAKANIPQDFTFKLGESPIRIAEPEETIRVVGAFITPDKKNSKTISNASQALGKAISFLYKKHTPSLITIYIINSVIIPRLLYRLQCTPTTPRFIESVNTRLRKLTRFKCALHHETTNDTLYNKNFWLGLMDLQVQLDKQTVNNAMLYSQSDSITAKVSREADKVFSLKMRTPRGILSHPIQHKLKKLYLMPHISSVLDRNLLQIRTNNAWGLISGSSKHGTDSSCYASN
jgi:hypothetical protein